MAKGGEDTFTSWEDDGSHTLSLWYATSDGRPEDVEVLLQLWHASKEVHTSYAPTLT